MTNLNKVKFKKKKIVSEGLNKKLRMQNLVLPRAL